MDLTDWNEPRLAGDWSDARPQRPMNLSPSFGLGDNLMDWNQPSSQHGDAGYGTRGLRGATQHGDNPHDPLRGPLQRPTVPFSPLMTEDAINGAWESQESKLSKMNENINQLLYKFLSLSDTVQTLRETVQSLASTVRDMRSTDRDLNSTGRSNMERRLNVKIEYEPCCS